MTDLVFWATRLVIAAVNNNIPISKHHLEASGTRCARALQSILRRLLDNMVRPAAGNIAAKMRKHHVGRNIAPMLRNKSKPMHVKIDALPPQVSSVSYRQQYHLGLDRPPGVLIQGKLPATVGTMKPGMTREPLLKEGTGFVNAENNGVIQTTRAARLRGGRLLRRT